MQFKSAIMLALPEPYGIIIASWEQSLAIETEAYAKNFTIMF